MMAYGLDSLIRWGLDDGGDYMEPCDEDEDLRENDEAELELIEKCDAAAIDRASLEVAS